MKLHVLFTGIPVLVPVEMPPARTRTDIDNVLADDRRAAKREELIEIAFLLGIALIVALPLWLWTTVEVGLLSGAWSHFFASIFGGFIVSANVAIFKEFPDAAEFTVSDSTLAKLAALNIYDKDGLSQLKDVLRAKGYIQLGQVDKFVQGERQMRLRQIEINKVGAKSFLVSG